MLRFASRDGMPTLEATCGGPCYLRLPSAFLLISIGVASPLETAAPPSADVAGTSQYPALCNRLLGGLMNERKVAGELMIQDRSFELI